jgi:hypothetical protein
VSEPRYTHTQVGWLVLAVVFGAAAVLFVVFLLTGIRGVPLAVPGIITIVALLFGWLKVTVDDRRVTARFGPGLVRKGFDLHEVVSAEPVRNKAWYGWGIRLTPHGWLFNVSGLDAVELTMRDGRRYRIGTDDPKGLARAVGKVVKRHAAA